ncbi:MAG: DUF3108 domain-containing protein [Bacteroidales bacterium]
MRSTLYTIALLLIISTGFSQEKPGIPVEDIKYEDLVFAHGETLRYVVNYTWGAVSTDVGEAKMSLEYFTNSGDPFFHVKATGRTFKFYDVFFKVRDLYESKFYARNLRPFYFHRDISEGKYRMKNIFSFLPNYQIKVWYQRKNKTPHDTILNGGVSTFDLLTLIYFTRNKDFSEDEIGKEQPFSFVIDGEMYDLYYRYLGKETKKIPKLGTFRTIKFAARVVAGEVFTGKEELIFWVTDDNNKIPLIIESPIIVGKVSGRLTNFTNIKYPFTSKIK